jgi:hypothetical protein
MFGLQIQLPNEGSREKAFSGFACLIKKANPNGQAFREQHVSRDALHIPGIPTAAQTLL